MRIAVIGTGILGACVGWNLVRHGAEVVFVDAARPGEGVTDWSFSWVNASNKTVRRSYFDLNVAGMAAHRELAETIGPGGWWHPSGHLRWTDDFATQAQNVETAGILADWDYGVEMWSGADVRSWEPALIVADKTWVLLYRKEGWVHGRRLVDRLLELAVAAGAECRFGTAVRDIGTRTDGSVDAVVLADGTRLDVDGVVNAAGPSAAEVAELVGRRLPMRWEPGAVARIACVEVPIRRVLHAPHVEIRPDGDTSMVLHSREIDALIDTGVEPAELGRLLLESARRVVTGLDDSHVVEARMSNRPIPGDGFPSAGAVPDVPGYYEAVSHSGITLGPVIGRLVAAEIISGKRDRTLADFRPERFGP